MKGGRHRPCDPDDPGSPGPGRHILQVEKGTGGHAGRDEPGPGHHILQVENGTGGHAGHDDLGQ